MAMALNSTLSQIFRGYFDAMFIRVNHFSPISHICRMISQSYPLFATEMIAGRVANLVLG
jgi:hypothetical protein